MIFDMTKRKGGGTIVPKTINANGVYDAAADNADGYSPVTVNVPTGIQPPATGWLPSDWDAFGNAQKITFYGRGPYGSGWSIPGGFMQLAAGYGQAFSSITTIDCDKDCRISAVDRNFASGVSTLRVIKMRFTSSFHTYRTFASGSLSTVYLLADLPINGAVMSSTAFSSSTLTDIYVSWGEGEVAGAPWGATNATIHYNYTED